MNELTSLAGARQLQKLMHYESDNVKKTLQAIKLPTVLRMVEGLRDSERIFVGGFGATRCIIELYGFLLNANFWKQIITINGSIADYIGRLNLIEARDALIVASLPPYSREDAQIARFARERGVKVYLFTDSPRCPAYPLSDEVMLCSSTSLLYTNSYTGLIASFKVMMDMWLLSNQKASEARMKGLTEVELQGYRDLATFGE
jgi:DNA-binding MurR/RpiR family transcriptional regulator